MTFQQEEEEQTAHKLLPGNVLGYVDKRIRRGAAYVAMHKDASPVIVQQMKESTRMST